MSSDISDFTRNQNIIEECKENAISIDEITKLAKLAKIKLSDEEKIEYAKELAGVVNWVNKLNEVEIDNIANSSHTTIQEAVTDEVGNEHTDVLSNTDTEYQCFVVPKIIENE